MSSRWRSPRSPSPSRPISPASTATRGRRTRLTDGGLTPQSGFFPLASPPPIRWTEPGITFAADACGRSGVWRVSPDGDAEAEVIRAEAELLNGVDLSADGSRIGAILTDPGQPGELSHADRRRRSRHA